MADEFINYPAPKGARYPLRRKFVSAEAAEIKIRGARVHNLKNVNVDIPKNKLVVITGISGSGKSSLAFDTLYAEGQRRYVESLSSYARQFLGIMQKPDADSIEGISPAISIDQRRAGRNPRSTVGTITEIYDYLRLLFARIGVPHCPNCKKVVSRQTIDQITDQVLKLPLNTEIVLLGPVVRAKKGEHQGVLQEVQKAGFVRARVNGIIYRIEEALEKELDKQKKHNIEVVVDRLILDHGLDKSRLVDSLETALKLGKGIVIINYFGGGETAPFRAGMKVTEGTRSYPAPLRDTPPFTAGRVHKSDGKREAEDLIFSERFACEECGISLPELEPRLFSFNAPFGACPVCHGLGEKLEVEPNLVMPNKNLTIAEGAIFPWAHASHKIGRQGYFWSKLQDLASRYKFSLDVPIKDLPKKIIDLILYGDGDFEGVVANLERRYRETDSEYSREEIGQYMKEKICEECQGKRLKPEILAITIQDKSIDDIVAMSITNAKTFFFNLAGSDPAKLKIAGPIIKEIINRLQFLIDVGLDYLSLNRRADTLSGGEEQRIRLATQIGSKLTGVLYILDEPSIGLHARDQQKLIRTLRKLQEIGNTVVVVEHDSQTILAADWVIDIGPGAGKHGGKVMFVGTPKQLLKSKTLTGEYLSGRKKVEVKNPKSEILNPKQIQNSKFLIIKKAVEHNLKNIDVKIPLGKLVCITGVSGSGKSTLMNDILAKALMKRFYRAKEDPGKHEAILGLENLNKAILVDQSAIGRTPRSNPATYVGVFSHVRDIFRQTKEARAAGYQVGRFSFNVKGGRCEACEGQGVRKIEMYFLPDVYVECEECHGKRFNKETLAIEYKGKNIADVLEDTIEDALEFFKNIPAIFQKLKTLNDVGLGYIQLGQPAPSLSGGEAQRVKLATELSKKGTGSTLYILDEPTTGLHFDDIKKLLLILKGLVEKGNTVLLIEHNLDVIKNAEWIIDLGPEGGEKGGKVIAEGLPSEIAQNKKSYTGQYLKAVLRS